MTITSPHNDRLKEIRKLARRRERALSGRFVAEGEDLLAAADAAGWPAAGALLRGGQRAGGRRGRARPAGGASRSSGSGTRALGVYEQRWADAPAGPLCVALHGIARPGQRRRRSCARRSRSARRRVALGPGCADPYGPKAVRASMGALFAVPLARYAARRGAARHASSRSTRTRTRRSPTWPRRRRGGAATGAALTLLVGAERAGLPDEVLAACDRGRADPDRLGVAQRRDGGDRRALRGHARRRRHGT